MDMMTYEKAKVELFDACVQMAFAKAKNNPKMINYDPLSAEAELNVAQARIDKAADHLGRLLLKQVVTR